MLYIVATLCLQRRFHGAGAKGEGESTKKGKEGEIQIPQFLKIGNNLILYFSYFFNDSDFVL